MGFLEVNRPGIAGRNHLVRSSVTRSSKYLVTFDGTHAPGREPTVIFKFESLQDVFLTSWTSEMMSGHTHTNRTELCEKGGHISLSMCMYAQVGEDTQVSWPAQ